MSNFVAFPFISNLVDHVDTVITSSIAGETDMLVGNVADSKLYEIFRVDDGATRSIVFDLSTAKTVRAIAVIGFNDEETGTGIRIVASTDNFAASNVEIEAFRHPHSSFVVDSGEWPYLQNYYVVFAQDESFRYWKVELNDPSNSTGFLQVRRVLLGDALFPKGDFSVEGGYSIGVEDSTVITTMRSGDDIADIGVVRRKHRLILDRLDPAHHQQIIDFSGRKGIHSDFCVVPNIDDDQDQWAYEGLYCRFVAPPGTEFFIAQMPRSGISTKVYRSTWEVVERTTG